MRIHKKLCLSLLAATSSLLLAPSVLAAPVVLELDYEIPVQQSQVAFVSFAGDSTLSPIILNDLSKTELKVTSQNLPQQPHSSSELAGTLPVWQSMGILTLSSVARAAIAVKWSPIMKSLRLKPDAC